MKAREAGFTLIEMLIALSIFGMLAAAGVGLLSYSMKAQVITTQKLDDVAELRRLSALLTQDLAQVVPQTSRDVSRGADQVFAGGESYALLTYTRAGAPSTTDTALSGPQRIAWSVIEGKLQRTQRAVNGAERAATPAVIVTNVQTANVRFRDKRVWQDRWLPSSDRLFPSAVEMTVRKSDGVPVTLLFIVGAGR
jgi:general secretion pathway protein J